MTQADRILLAVALIAIDLLVFFLPLTGLLVAYVLVVRPPWFKRWITTLYGEG